MQIAKEILAAKRAGKVAMVIGWQDSAVLEEEQRQRLAEQQPAQDQAARSTTSLGSAQPICTYQYANQFGGGMLDPTVPLTVQGK